MRRSRLVQRDYQTKEREEVEFNFSKENTHLFTDLNKTESQRQAALEMIAYQDGKFHKELKELIDVEYFFIKEVVDRMENKVEAYRFLRDEFAKRTQPHKQIEALIKKHTGIKVSFIDIPEEFGQCSIFAPVLTSSPVLVTPSRNEEARKNFQLISFAYIGDFFKKEINKYKGTIDLKRSRVSGFYSEIELPIYFDAAYYVLFTDPAISSALILHEVGHGFFGFEFAFRTQVCAQVMAHLHQIKTNRGSDLIYEQTLDACIENLKTTKMIHEDVDFEIDSQKTDETVVQTLLLSSVWAKLSYDFGNERSQSPNFEVLADNFAIRHGAGQDLFRYMSFYVKISNPRAEDSLQYFHELASTCLLGAFAGVGSALVFSLAASLGVGLGVTIMGILLKTCFSGETKLDYNDPNLYNQDKESRRVKHLYDDDYIRCTKMKEGLIRSLKENKHLSNREKRTIAFEIEDISKFLEQYRAKGTFYDTLANLIFKERRLTKTAMQIQRELEKLADNDLFASSQKLKTISL